MTTTFSIVLLFSIGLSHSDLIFAILFLCILLQFSMKKLDYVVDISQAGYIGQIALLAQKNGSLFLG